MRVPMIPVLPVLLALCFTHGPLSAQQPILGSSVRVRPVAESGGSHAPWTAGQVARIEADSLWIVADGQPRPFAVRNVDVQLQHGSQGTAGVILGALSGVLLGSALGAVLYEPEFATRCALFVGCDEPTQINSRKGDMVQHALAIGVLGGSLGWLIGRSRPGWVPTTVEGLRLGPEGFVVGLRF